MQATARHYLLSPELLGELGTVQPEDVLRLGTFGWLPLAAIAGQTIRDLAVLRDLLDDEVPALALPAQARFASPTAFNDFVRELSEEIARLLAKHADETASNGPHWFFLGAYPVVPAQRNGPRQTPDGPSHFLTTGSSSQQLPNQLSDGLVT